MLRSVSFLERNAIAGRQIEEDTEKPKTATVTSEFLSNWSIGEEIEPEYKFPCDKQVIYFAWISHSLYASG